MHEHTHRVFNQGVTLSVPNRCSRRSSPAGCFSTTPTKKKQIMIPHFQTQRKLPCLPLCPLVLPFHICSQDQLLCEKMKINNERKVREGMRICLLTRQKKKKKTPKESNMSSLHCHSVLCPPAFHMSQTIFRNHQRRSHIHRSVYNTRSYNN